VTPSLSDVDDPDHGKRNIGKLLIIVAVLLGAFSLNLWRSKQDDADSRRETNEMVNALAGTSYDLGGEDADPSMPIAGGAAAAVLFLSGVILIAGAQAPQRPDAPTDP
jgi:hypothetical protein